MRMDGIEAGVLGATVDRLYDVAHKICIDNRVIPEDLLTLNTKEGNFTYIQATCL